MVVGPINSRTRRAIASSSDGTKLAAIDPSVSLSVFQRTSAANSIAASIERSPKGGTLLTCGGTRQVSSAARVRGKWGTSGVLAAQMLSAVVLHRVPPEVMRALYARLEGVSK